MPGQSNEANPQNDDSDFDELMADDTLTPEKLQEKLNEYQLAYQQEYEQATAQKPENVEEFTRDFFKKNVPMAANQIVWLAGNADSESVKLQASKIVIAEALADARADGDPIADLLNGLTKNKAKSAATKDPS